MLVFYGTSINYIASNRLGKNRNVYEKVLCLLNKSGLYPTVECDVTKEFYAEHGHTKTGAFFLPLVKKVKYKDKHGNRLLLLPRHL